MKKLFIIMFLLIGTLNVCAYSRLELLEQNKKIDEEIFPIRDENSKFLGVSCVITIPEDFSKDSIVINPDIFGGINEYKKMETGSNIINLKIVNKSKNNYAINSFDISTKEITDKNNYKKILGFGFDGREIYDVFSPYRVINTAIKNLFVDESIDFNSNKIEAKLKEKGYKNINDLDNYYLDFYNDKYDLNCSSLSEFDSFIIREIFTGDSTNYFEEDREIIELGYYYFYKFILYSNFLDNDYKDLVILSGKTREINNLKINITDKYMTDAFNDYKYIGLVELGLNRRKAE